MRKQTNTLSPSPKGFQSPKFSDSDFREVRGLGLGRPKSSGCTYEPEYLLIYLWKKNLGKFLDSARSYSRKNDTLGHSIPGAD
jgi:hypothetical protein